MMSPGMGGDIEKVTSRCRLWRSLSSPYSNKNLLSIPWNRLLDQMWRYSRPSRRPCKTQQVDWDVMRNPQASFPHLIHCLLLKTGTKGFKKIKRLHYYHIKQSMHIIFLKCLQLKISRSDKDWTLLSRWAWYNRSKTRHLHSPGRKKKKPKSKHVNSLL